MRLTNQRLDRVVSSPAASAQVSGLVEAWKPSIPGVKASADCTTCRGGGREGDRVMVAWTYDGRSQLRICLPSTCSWFAVDSFLLIRPTFRLSLGWSVSSPRAPLPVGANSSIRLSMLSGQSPILALHLCRYTQRVVMWGDGVMSRLDESAAFDGSWRMIGRRTFR